MLRFAKEEDFQYIFSMVQKFGQYSEYGEAEEDKVLELFQTFQPNQPSIDRLLLVFETDGEPVGFILGVINEHILNREKTATELAWWVNEEHRRGQAALELLDGFEYWARAVGCTRIVMSLIENKNSDKLGSLYEKRDYKLVERAYLKKVED